MIAIFVVDGDLEYVIDVFHVEREDFLPGGREGFVFGLGLEARVAEFEYAEGVGFAAKIGGG